MKAKFSPISDARNWKSLWTDGYLRGVLASCVLIRPFPNICTAHEVIIIHSWTRSRVNVGHVWTIDATGVILIRTRHLRSLPWSWWIHLEPLDALGHRPWGKPKAKTAFQVHSLCKVASLWWIMLVLIPKSAKMPRAQQICSDFSWFHDDIWGLRNLRLGLSNKEVAQIFNSLSANSFRVAGTWRLVAIRCLKLRNGQICRHYPFAKSCAEWAGRFHIVTWD